MKVNKSPGTNISNNNRCRFTLAKKFDLLFFIDISFSFFETFHFNRNIIERLMSLLYLKRFIYHL